MRHASVHRVFLQGAGPAAAADDAAIGAWVRVLSLAAELELGDQHDAISKRHPLGEGRIPGCRQWTDAQWMRTTGTSAGGVEALVGARLARWHGDDLLIAGYDCWGERAYDAKRGNGAKGGRPTKGEGAQEPTGYVSDNRAGTETAALGVLPSPPLLSPPDPDPDTRSRKRKRGGSAGAGGDPDFAAFYEAWPRKRSRGDAEKAWRQTAGQRPALPIVLEAIARLKREGRPMDKTPYPATWLRAAGWADDIPAGAAASTSSVLAEISRENAERWR
jgi:hypothetical protein